MTGGRLGRRLGWLIVGGGLAAAGHRCGPLGAALAERLRPTAPRVEAKASREGRIEFAIGHE